jgi:hypothetical protein
MIDEIVERNKNQDGPCYPINCLALFQIWLLSLPLNRCGTTLPVSTVSLNKKTEQSLDTTFDE